MCAWTAYRCSCIRPPARPKRSRYWLCRWGGPLRRTSRWPSSTSSWSLTRPGWSYASTSARRCATRQPRSVCAPARRVAPERSVIDRYDINGYFSKLETSEDKLYSLVKAGVRQHEYMTSSLILFQLLSQAVGHSNQGIKDMM